MMAAYQPQPGAMHPGMAPHAHPSMNPGQPMNPAQMQQMGHPGAVTPGPHVTQGGAMMAMQPGAGAMGGPAAMGGQHPGGQMGGMPAQMGGQSMAGGMPNAHALSHLTPQAQAMQQQQMLQQQQQQLQANPQLMHQHALMARRMQAMQASGNMNGMQQNAIQNLSPQQIHQLQQNNQGMAHPQPVQLPPHLQQQQMLARLQQQQQAQQQNQQMAQAQAQISMQHANSQQSNQSGQPTPQNQQGGQAQHPGQQMRPQSRTANPNEQSQANAQQNAQQTNQQGQTQQSQQQQQQQQAAQQNQQNQQAAAAAQPSGQQSNPQQGQQQGQQQPPMNPQQFQIMQRQRQLQNQQQAMMMQQQRQQAQQAQQTQQQSGNGIFILRAIQFGDHLSSFDSVSGKDIAMWHSFVDRHFAAEGRFIHSFNWEGGSRKYEIPRATIPRYFQMYFDSNASYVQLHMEHVREAQVQPNRHQVSFSNATFTVAYPNAARLEMSGTVRMLFAPNSDVIELMELHTAKSEEYINRQEIERVMNNWSPTMANKASPKMTKKNIPKGQQKMQSQFEGFSTDYLPKTPKAILGTPDRVQHFFEITESMSLMADLIAFAHEKKLRPEQALEAWVQENESAGQQPNQQGNPQINLPQNGVPVGNRTPSMPNMQMPNAQAGNQFSSPNVSNLNLPMQNGIPGMNGSPHIANNTGLAPNMNLVNSHTPSPHQSNMAAPPMVPQHSQQGTNSSAASANTSPNVNNKRRRSTVKLENEDGTAEGGGRVKPSPRMPKKSKPGG